MEMVASTTQRLAHEVADKVQDGTEGSSHLQAKNLLDVNGRVALVTGKLWCFWSPRSYPAEHLYFCHFYHQADLMNS
jgi:hypothetical protein